MTQFCILMWRLFKNEPSSKKIQNVILCPISVQVIKGTKVFLKTVAPRPAKASEKIAALLSHSHLPLLDLQ